jgi:membrane protease YdiL (CAAX protease family)
MTEVEQGSTASTAPGPRVKPSIAAGFVLYVGYLAIFYATWAINDVDYPTIGETTRSAKLHYALPTLFGSTFLVVMVTAFGWWRITLFDKERSGPRWGWIGPIFMGLVAISSLAMMNTDGATAELVMWSVLGGLGVGFGEEMITRGGLLVGFRTKYPEQRVWLFTTLLFSALHIPNALFGESVPAMIGQVVLTFIFGSLLWATRRLAGTLLLSMFLHGIWDSSIFLPGATDSGDNPVALLLYPIAIVVTVAVVRRNKDLRLG